MKIHFKFWFFLGMFSAITAMAQRGPVTPGSGRPLLNSTNKSGGYISDLKVLRDAQRQAIDQAKEMLGRSESEKDKSALQAAIKEMERSQSALEAAGDSPEKLPAAIAAQQNAYQALLKVTPREYRMTRSQNGGQSGQSGQPSPQQLQQLDMTEEQNRYETERQAAAPPNPQQREQLQTADRLKELAQRQQDLNERLRELQTALQAAKTEPEREELERQLKRLRDEERQMLADVDKLRQQLEQSPNASQNADARQQLEQTRSDMQKAAQEMESQSPSSALAAGTRAQQTMQNLREDLRRQTSSQFTEQMRELRNQARELARKQEQIAQGMDALENGKQSLDNSAERQKLVDQMTRQQGALTNLLSQMRSVTEQAESTEPLLSRQLYDTLRRADQARTDNLLEMSTQLANRGFLPQASEAERSARQNINELRQGVERAAESVLGNEADALRYAQKELDDLTRQVESELPGGGTNAIRQSEQGNSGESQSQSNRVARSDGRSGSGDSRSQTNQAAGARGNIPGQGADENSENQSNQTAQAGSGQGEAQSSRGQSTSREASQSQGQGQGQAAAQQPGEGRGEGQAQGQGQRGQGQGQGETPGNPGSQVAQGRGRGGNQGGGTGAPTGENSPAQQGNASSASAQGGSPNSGGGNSGGNGNGLRDFVRQLGQNQGRGGNGNNGGPITGNDFVNWSDRLRDVERVLDSPDLRNEVATARERAGALRAQYRERGQQLSAEAVREEVLAPLSQVRVWLQEELARQRDPNGLVPLDRDPVPENYSELVRKYYEKLGSAQ